MKFICTSKSSTVSKHLTLLIILITGYSFSVQAQQQIFFWDAKANKVDGFSYTVTVNVSTPNINNVQRSAGYTVELVSATPDSKGYYHHGTDKYYSCAELGAICEPSKNLNIYIVIPYQCRNTGDKTISFFSKGSKEQTMVLGITENGSCQLGNMKVSSLQLTNSYVFKTA